MTRLKFNKIIFFSLLFFPAGLIYGQNKISARATVDKNKILIGDRLNLFLEATYPQGNAIIFFKVDSIPHFVIIDSTKTDTSKTAGKITLKRQFLLTSFDSGRRVIPPFILNKKIKTDSVPVTVMFSDFDPSKDYHDIKDIVELPPVKDRNWWLLPAVISVLVVVAMAWLLWQRKSQNVIAEIPKIDAYKEAMQQLQQAERNTGSPKQFYSLLIDIFRLYVFRKKGILSLQETTDDLVVQLRQLNLEKELFGHLSQSLQLSDSVKFAKFIPSEQDNKMTFETIKRSIEEIERLIAK
ncbi:MAG: hypothetical protein IT214_03705 [Chitinophagaceae bacterium]|jgi:hypothetical protein|nr:hypothetical protein [Chitinophagaceae bacterium]OQY95760.1 MAG: hypothetical protein B6D37_04705 [Sphingobacteriales bacterium UTBCD1]